MIDIRNILCPIDFSDFSRRALDHAIAVAHRYDATLAVVHVCPSLPPIAYAASAVPITPIALTDDDLQRLRVEVQAFVTAESAPGIRFETVLRQGDPVREILDEAAARKADLLTVGTHGRSGFERLFLGSVTERLLRRASCPVLTVPRRQPGTVPTSAQFKRILCAIDFSECSMAALRHATSLVEEVDGDLTVLYVVANDLSPLPDQPRGDQIDPGMSIAEFFIKREENVRQLLKAAIPDGVRTYCSVDTRVAHGKPSDEILALAREHASDLIVIGVHGRSAADLAVFGSTAQQVVRQATCPVLTIRLG